MSTINFTAELHAENARESLRRLLDRLDRRQPFFAEVGQKLADSTRARFRSQTAPDGTPWTPLRPATIKARLRSGRAAISILRETGALVGSISHAATNDDVQIGSTSEYAAIHQLGGNIDMPARRQTLYFQKLKKGAGRRFAKKHKATSTQDVDRKAHSITIPARPFLGISKQDQQDIFEAAEGWLDP
ncbi:MAG: phage virion morphogenesis protein [Paracoccus denitrificans]|nr:MAG: phage virion morphogenesis protein [Paracoccus denitrificans]PZO83656.1 MAG: phage virion morphogenesis protein [Paracoccus denitrificans]